MVQVFLWFGKLDTEIRIATKSDVTSIKIFSPSARSQKESVWYMQQVAIQPGQDGATGELTNWRVAGKS